MFPATPNYYFASHFPSANLSEKKIAELQLQLRVSAAELASEKNKNGEMQRVLEQQSRQSRAIIDHLEQVNVLLQQQITFDKENTAARTRQLQSQIQDKEAAILRLEVRFKTPAFARAFVSHVAGITKRHAAKIKSTSSQYSRVKTAACIRKRSL